MVLRVAAVMVLAGAGCVCVDWNAAFGAADAPMCEASARTRRVLDELRAHETFGEKWRREHLAAIDGLLAKNPDDMYLHLDYIRTESRETEAEVEAVSARYKSLMEKHPGDSEYEFLYAAALIDSNTPEAIERLKRIPADAAVAPQAELRLTKIYEFGKFADRDEGRKELTAYLNACPASVDIAARDYAESLATPELAAMYAAALRKRLEKDKDPTLVGAWVTAWNMEFAAKPTQQDQVRAKMQQDLQRLRKSPAKELDYLTTMQAGYRMAGDKTSQREMEDRIIAEYPESDEADMTASRRFEDGHPYPEKGSAEEKQAYQRAALAQADAQLKKEPGRSDALRDRFEALENLDGVSNDEIVSAGEALRTALKGERRWYSTPPTQFRIARVYLDRSVRDAEVPDLIAEGRADYDQRQQKHVSDRETDELKKAMANNDTYVLFTEAELLEDAASALKKPEMAKDEVEKVASAKVDSKYFLVEAWEIKGKWAELNGRKLDALLMYRASLDARVVGYKVRGKKDATKEAYERLWKDLGGTDGGNDAWLAAVAGAKTGADGGWERVSKDLPDTKMVDLNGKAWSIGELKGKKVLINIWASWCGPCRGELPYLQALYEKVKDRKDIAVISMSVDESIGEIAPFVKEKNYSFPVLLGSRYVTELAAGLGVPQNWIVGTDGKWEWKQEGFGDGEGWEKGVMEKLEGKTGETK